MATQKLTKQLVDALPQPSTDCVVWDKALAGFGLRLRPSGSKTFIVQYRVGGGRRGRARRFTIGRYGIFTVDEARAEAKKLLGAVATGQDPAGNRYAQRREITVSDLIELYARSGVDHLRSANRQFTLARLNNHVVPLLGRKKISEVRVSDIEQFMRDVTAGKTAKDEKIGPRARVIVKGGGGAAVKCARSLSAVFAFAIRNELLTTNPCAAVKIPSDGKRERFLSLEEVKRLGAELEVLEAEGANLKAVAIIRLWALTGCRRDEIAGLKWCEVDFDRACLRLEKTKTGRSVRPLAGAAISIIQSQPRDTSSAFVFPSEDGSTFYQGTKRLWARVVNRAGLQGVTPHTLRHTIGSAAVSSGETLAMTGALLGHSDNRSTSIYAHMQHDPARRAADRVVGPIATALGVQQAAVVLKPAKPWR